MEETIQINIRVSKSLARDIEEVASLLKIDRTEWIRNAIARDAFEEHKRLLAEIGKIEEIMDAHMKSFMKRARERRVHND